jgi:CDP-paratose 2-epimerase
MKRLVPRPVVVTGGAGFVGSNLAHRLLSDGERVLLFDNLSRPGVERNLRWLQQRHPGRLTLRVADIRDAAAVRDAVARASAVYHLAAQVAVTTSLADPVTDFAINAGGTLNVLEAVRAARRPPPLVFTSTNKVYGALDDLPLRTGVYRYEADEETLGCEGVSEERPLEFHSPYGCSKGAADQYVLDYARTFGLPATVFRMSCIYGPRQFGNEDQGWLAHFLIRAIAGEPITIYGDGRQVRDALYVDDLVAAFLAARERIDHLAGQAFNIGGGPANTVSLLELVRLIGEMRGGSPAVAFEDWRLADQRYYVSDTRRFQAAARWRSTVDLHDGIERLYAWLFDNGITAPAAPAPRAALAQSR